MRIDFNLDFEIKKFPRVRNWRCTDDATDRLLGAFFAHTTLNESVSYSVILCIINIHSFHRVKKVVKKCWYLATDAAISMCNNFYNIMFFITFARISLIDFKAFALLNYFDITLHDSYIDVIFTIGKRFWPYRIDFAADFTRKSTLIHTIQVYTYLSRRMVMSGIARIPVHDVKQLQIHTM